MHNYALLQQEIAEMSKKDAVEHLHAEYPHRSERWFSRNLPYLMALDPVGLSEVLGHSDPTANKAIRNVLKEAS